MTERHFFPKYRVFIYGTEVSDDIISVTITQQDGRTPSTCTVELTDLPVAADGTADAVRSGTSYARSKYFITPEMLSLIYSNVKLDEADVAEARALELRIAASAAGLTDTSGMQDIAVLSAAARTSADIYASALVSQVSARLADSALDPLTKQVLTSKFPIVRQLKQAPWYRTSRNVEDIAIKDILSMQGTAQRYPLQAGHSIFHPNDPIRVFARDPENPRRWYHMFAGLLGGRSRRIDKNNQATVRFFAESPLKLARYARFSTNPGIFDAEQVVSEVDEAKYIQPADLAGLSLVQYINTIFFGSETAGTTRALGTSISKTSSVPYTRYNPVAGKTFQSVQRDGVGAFNAAGSKQLLLNFPGADIVTETPTMQAEVIQSLAEYEAIIDHEVRTSDLTDMAVDASQIPLTADSVRLWPDGQVDANDIVEAIGTHPDVYPVDFGRVFMLLPRNLGLFDRNVLLRDVAGPAMYSEFSTRLAQVYTVLEQLDFTMTTSGRGDVLIEMPLYDFHPYDFGTDANAPLAARYIVTHEDFIEGEDTLSDEGVLTQMQCGWNVFTDWKIQQTNQSLGEPNQIARRDALIPLYGLRDQVVPPRNYVGTPQAAKLLAEITLNRANSESFTFHVTALPNLALNVTNRPIELLPLWAIGAVRRVTHTYRANSSMSTDIDINYARSWTGVYDAKGRRQYEWLGGTAAQPFNYAQLFDAGETKSPAALLPTNIA